MSMQGHNTKPPEAWVVFTGQTDLPWLKILKPSFRHCYVLLNDGLQWISFDPLSNYLDVSVHHHVPAGFDLPQWLESRGHKIMQAPVKRIKKEAPWMVFTCVEAVKRVLGLHARFILTPWQLYCHLQKSSSKQTIQKGELAWEA